jgi:outer membrane protein assembly factor BamA
MIGKGYTILGICFLITACSTTRNLPKGDALYTGATVTLHADNITLREKKVIRNDLQEMTRPEPNSRFLGIPVRLMIWNMFSTKKENSFFGKLRSKWGERPVLASQLDLEQNIKILESHLENKGFFNAKVKGDSSERRRKVKAHYIANAGNRYKITSVEYPNDSSDLSQTINASASKSLIKVGAPFDLDAIKGERERIDAYLKERGFYYFSPEYILALADSSEQANDVKMRFVVKPDVPEEARRKYFINDVYIYSDYSLNTATIDTVRSDAEYFKGYYVVDRNKKYQPQLFEQAMQFNPGEVYNRSDHNKTLNRLMNLNVFKFVKNRFEPIAADSPKLNVFYYLTPFPKQAIRGEIGTTTRSNNLNGSEIRLGYHHRNFFKAGEQFDFRIYGGTEVQFSGAFSGYNTYRTGGEIDFSIPRFVVPFGKFNSRSAYIPRTHIQLGYELLDRIKLYTLNSFRTQFGYTWKESAQKSHELYPLTVNYVLAGAVADTFKTEMLANPSLRHITDTQFILGGTYQYNMNQQLGGIQRVNSFYFNGLIDGSGNLAGLLLGNQKRLFNLPYAQYLKMEADGRYYRKIGLASTWANRIVIGYGLPYGNSTQLPYVKQFFVGGNNSIRAFRSRTVGPGTYKAPKTQAGYIPDQTGDIKMELNTEFRPRISGPVYGAFFIDAGNIWLKNEDSTRPGSGFNSNFLSELAVGTGVGIRLDIQLFVIRFDVAFPIKDPSKPQGQRWIMNNINFGDTKWRRENVIYNLAIGYPF